MNLSIGLCECSVIQLFLTLSETDWTVARQAPLSMRLPRQQYWNGLPFPSPGDLPHPEIELVSPTSPILAGGFFTAAPPERNRTALVVQWLRLHFQQWVEGLISVWGANTLYAVWYSQKKKKKLLILISHQYFNLEHWVKLFCKNKLPRKKLRP